MGTLNTSERIILVINWEPTDLEESDCLIKTKQRARLQTDVTSL